MSRPVISTEYVRVTITDRLGQSLDGTVEIAVIPDTRGNEPITGDWKTAAWEGSPASSRVAYLLTGPDSGAINPTAGDYAVWYHLPDTPENIRRRAAGVLRID
jgi:hypothetical protein